MGAVPRGCRLDFVDLRDGWCSRIGAAAGSSGVALYRSVDGGGTWTLTSHTSLTGASTPAALPGGCDKSIAFSAATVGWAASFCNGGGAYLYRSGDAGRRWAPTATVPLPPGAPTPQGEGLSLPVVAGPELALSIDIGGPPGARATAIATSSDGGASWHSQLIPGPAQYWSVDLIDPTHWRATNGRVLLASNDAGRRWRSKTLPEPVTGPAGTLPSLDFISPTFGWALPGANGGPFWWTSDGGATWKPVTIKVGPYTVPR